MKIYIASSWTNKTMVKEASEILSRAGFETTQRWPNQLEDADPEVSALEDIADIERADIVLLYSFGKASTGGGMHFETGYAYATSKVVLVGKVTSVFHHLLEQYISLDAFIKAYQEDQEDQEDEHRV